MKHGTAFVALFFLFSAFVSYADFSAPQFWEPSIERALISRDDFYRDVDLERRPLQFDFLWDRQSARLLEERVRRTAAADNPWYHFLLGVTVPASSSSERTPYFTKALELTNESPGMTWLLFMECRRVDKYSWAQSCLRQLERVLMLEGAEASAMISQQLLAVAREERRNKNLERAVRYLEWSARFDRTGLWQAFLRARWYFPMRPRLFIRAAADCAAIAGGSWRVQLSAAYHAYQWMRAAIVILVVVLFTAIAAKTVPALFVSFGALFPRGVPRWLQFALCGLVFASLALLGLVPFVIVSSILFWRHTDGQDRAFLAVCIAATLLVAPGTRLTAAFVDTLSPYGSLGMFDQAAGEGYTQELEERIRARIAKQPDDYLARVSLAGILRKVSDYRPMKAHVLAARRSREDDPVVLVASGNAYFSAGEYERAAHFYRLCINGFPSYGAAYYNLARCIEHLDGPVDSAFLYKLPKLKTRRIREFEDRNKAAFGADVPALRAVIQPDYRPAYFWLHVFPLASGLGSDIKSIHRLLLRKLPSLLATVAAVGIFALAFAFARRLLQKRQKRGDEAPMRIVMKDGQYLRRRNRHLIYIPGIMDAVFPGAGSLFRTSRDVRAATLMLMLSSMVYATYWVLFHFTFSCPFWVVRAGFIAIGCLCAAYSIAIAFVVLRKMLHDLNV
ncbi:MAG: hypothetical protein GF418_00510 [Chitinivibrionales bacterium]|nr:hypothetical protein [Chitinivibrionales bacterium]MBD3394082.1 hypothetical protein [Chitinivibrionales bacterium]